MQPALEATQGLSFTLFVLRIKHCQKSFYGQAKIAKLQRYLKFADLFL